MTPNQKISLIAFFAIIAIFAVASSTIPVVFAQDMDYTHDDKMHEDKSGKSCPGKNKEGMIT
ncbi:MAG TPA: hypothetical protein VNL34_02680 [Candidatus Nitrosotenuis sp.]|nr:hypothetical protein [Candidatus Nitrosotenuis sp.]